jgi:hypothetical protein
MPTVKAPDLQVNKKFEADAPDAALNIAAEPRAPLKTGTYTFQLVVVDDAKNQSAPATFSVTVVDDTAPTAVITGPERIPFGKAFALSGERSSDAGDGKIVRFIWTLIRTP